MTAVDTAAPGPSRQAAGAPRLAVPARAGTRLLRSLCGVVHSTLLPWRRFALPILPLAHRPELVQRRGFARHHVLREAEAGSRGHGPVIAIGARLPARRHEFTMEGVRGLREGRFAPLHIPVRYEFDLHLDPCSGDLPGWDGLMQWHGIPNSWLGDRDCRPAGMIAIGEGRVRLGLRSSRRLLRSPLHLSAEERRAAAFDREVSHDLGPVEALVGRWTRWSVRAVWSYRGEAGGIRVIRDGAVLVDDRGANCFNDLRGGPYWKIGAYTDGQRRAPDGRYAFWPRRFANVRCSVGAPAAGRPQLSPRPCS